MDLEEFLKGRRVDKLIIRSLPETQPVLVEKAKELNLEHCAAFPTSAVLFEFVNPEINKGYGIQRVCEHYGLKLENIVAFGDEANDMQMLSLAGTGVAMQNAVPAVKFISDVVSDYTNDESALGHFIEDVIIPNSEGKLDF
ncbi:MAG: HAD-IIB family hydrolase [Erysipelotrichaceae bacterium]|nr:HAD-IIB family hydrolase [Erysipelotrichaceae bacterium]